MIGDRLPDRPFFSCEKDAFVIVDQAKMGASFMTGKIEHWFRFEVAGGNVFDSRPLKVIDHTPLSAVVECEDSTVSLDVESGSARKKTHDGREWVYLSGLDAANSGAGWMPVS